MKVKKVLDWQRARSSHGYDPSPRHPPLGDKEWAHPTPIGQALSQDIGGFYKEHPNVSETMPYGM